MATATQIAVFFGISDPFSQGLHKSSRHRHRIDFDQAAIGEMGPAAAEI
jgi:hypothetical protein